MSAGIDDLGAIPVIALFYVSDFSVAYFGSSLLVFGILLPLLAFNNPEIIGTAKLSILITSALAGTIGYLFLKERKEPEHAAR